MVHLHQRKEGLSAAIFGLWRNWAIAVGVLIILAFLSITIRQVWMAPVSLICFFALQLLRGIINKQRVPVCSRLYKEVSIIVLIIAGVIIIRNFTGITGGPDDVPGVPLNARGPLIGILISAPVTSLVALIFLLQRQEPLVCLLCRQRYGSVIRNGFVGILYEREWRYQTRLLCMLSLLISAAAWAYYLTRYINVSFNRADYFFFLWMPVSVYVMSLIFLGWRYYSLWVYYCQRDEGHIVELPSSTTVRFLVLCDDKILLNMRQTDKIYTEGVGVMRFDTPASYTLPYQEHYDLPMAIELFQRQSGIVGTEIRKVYASPDNVTFHNLFHYIAFLDSDQLPEHSHLDGEWLSLGEIRQLMSQHLTGLELNAELARIYSVAMAWKTYNREGRRLYPFKHYRPTFRLKDLRSWDVDYSDPHWLSVWRLNEDCRCFRLRRWLFNFEECLRGANS
jgi:hypothetical protein